MWVGTRFLLKEPILKPGNKNMEIEVTWIFKNKETITFKNMSWQGGFHTAAVHREGVKDMKSEVKQMRCFMRKG